MSAAAAIASPQPGARPVWQHFPESFAQTDLSLSTERCAPSVITWMPRGKHLIRPGNVDHAVWVVVDEGVAAVANRHLQAMRTRAAAGHGPAPRFDFNHNSIAIGEPIELFWKPEFGIQAFVKWAPAVEKEILAGIFTSFSPEWIHAGSRFLGLRACCGSLLSSSHEPAFGVRMPKISPIKKRDALKQLQALYLDRVNRRWQELQRSTDKDRALLQAWETTKADRPEWAAAHELLEAIAQERLTDAKIFASR